MGAGIDGRRRGSNRGSNVLVWSSDRRKVPPFGLDGGEPSIVGDQWIERADGTREALEGRCRTKIGVGDVSAVQTPGGGGLGDRPAAGR
jgi:5-oxoprolinase (ATP-hydrolysing)